MEPLDVDQPNLPDLHPIEEVRLTVDPNDNPELPALTFRTWVLGITSCCLLAFLNQFFNFRTNPLSIGTISAQIVVLPIGKFMAATLRTKPIKVPFTKWSFSLNPGPFNVKEHVLITIFATSGASGVYALHIVTSVKAFYRREIHFVAAYLLVLTTQMLGYGWAGLFRKYLVDSPYMWWPSNLIQVTLFRVLHEKDHRAKGALTRLQFFLIVFVSSFVYYTVPGYLFPTISYISIACYIWKDSIVAQQIGSGFSGFGIGAFGLDWSTVAFLGSPMATPAFAIFNNLAGFVLTVYVAYPILYYFNIYESRRFPIFSSKTFDYVGEPYNISRILNSTSFDLDIPAYEGYSKLYISGMFAITYGMSFAALTATISHVILFHGKKIWRLTKETKEAAKKNYIKDVHTWLMKKNYAEVPQWWFHLILVSMVTLAVVTCEGFGGQLQLPWWGVLAACAMAFFFTLPIGIINATTNMGPGLNVISEMAIGYLYPGKPLANIAFKTYAYISMNQALSFLVDLKLGQYMKIPPISMFLVQLVSTVLASSVYFGTAWWLLTTVKDICDTSVLPEGSPWTCPNDNVFYSASIIWGVVGPGRMFTTKGVYPELNWFFILGFLAPVPVWLLVKCYPEKKYLRLINMPILIGAGSILFPTRTVNVTMWIAVGLFFNWFVYKRYKTWWARYNYVLSAALDAGVAFMGILLFVTLQRAIDGIDWWGLGGDHCTLAACPTAPGIRAKGCPVL